MKYLSIVVILFSSINSLAAQDALNMKVNLVEISFNTSLDFNDLSELKNQLSKLNIDLKYQILEFNEEGKLKRISFKVNCNDGFSGSASSEQLLNKSPIGFYRDYRAGATSAFGTGSPTAGKLKKLLEK